MTNSRLHDPVSVLSRKTDIIMVMRDLCVVITGFCMSHMGFLFS